MKRISFALLLIIAFLLAAPLRTQAVARRGSAGHPRIGTRRRAIALRKPARRVSRAGHRVRQVRRPVKAARAYRPVITRRKARVSRAAIKRRRVVSKPKRNAVVLSSKPTDLFSSLAAADKPAESPKIKPSGAITGDVEAPLKEGMPAVETVHPLKKNASAAQGTNPRPSASTGGGGLSPASEAATRRAFEEAGKAPRETATEGGNIPGQTAKKAVVGAKAGIGSKTNPTDAQKASVPPPDGDANPSLGKTVLDLATKLALTLAIGVSALFFLSKKYGVTPRRSGGQLQLLDSASLGPNRSVHLLRVRGKLLVIGATSDRITILSEIPDSAESELPLAGDSASFSDQLTLFADSEDGSEIDLKVRAGNSYLKDRAASLAQSLLRKKGPLS